MIYLKFLTIYKFNSIIIYSFQFKLFETAVTFKYGQGH